MEEKHDIKERDTNTNLMQCVAQQQYGVVVKREPSVMFHAGRPPHQQSVTQSYEQPASTNSHTLSQPLVCWVCVCVCVCMCVCVCVRVCLRAGVYYNLKGKAL